MKKAKPPSPPSTPLEKRLANDYGITLDAGEVAPAPAQPAPAPPSPEPQPQPSRMDACDLRVIVCAILAAGHYASSRYLDSTVIIAQADQLIKTIQNLAEGEPHA